MARNQPEDPLFEWERQVIQGLERDLEGAVSDEERQRQLIGAVILLGGASAAVAALLVMRAF